MSAVLVTTQRARITEQSDGAGVLVTGDGYVPVCCCCPFEGKKRTSRSAATAAIRQHRANETHRLRAMRGAR